MRNCLVDRRASPHADASGGGSNEPKRNPNIEEPHMDNFTSEFNPNEIVCDPALRNKYMSMPLKFKTKLGEHTY